MDKKIYKTMKQKDKIVEAIDILIKDIRKKIINNEHRSAEISIDCTECKARILEAYLDWYKYLSLQ